MKKYICKETVQKNLANNNTFWHMANEQLISCYPWKSEARTYTPNTRVRLLHNKTKLFARFDIDEENIRATYTQPNDPVCRDSCVEFFFSPCNTDNRYLSFEINPLGTMLIGIGTKGNDIEYLYCDRGIFDIRSGVGVNTWWVEFAIPFDFVKNYFKEISPTWQGNFMKCADLSKTPHHGSWNLIETEIPMFHVPQFFGTIVLQQFHF